MDERYEEVGGYQVRYLEAGSGPLLVLVHGLGGSAVVFRANIPVLAEHFRVLALDLPGHGHSEKPDDTGYEAEAGARFLADFVKAKSGGEPAALIGVSAGGLLCGLTASNYPELVSRLVLVDSAGLGRELSWQLRLPALPFVGRWFVPASVRAVRALLATLVYDPAVLEPWLIEEVYQERILPGNRDALYMAFRTNVGLLGLQNWQHYQRQMLSLPHPTLIVWGAEDRLIPVRHAYDAAPRLKDGRLHVFERCGHWPFYERADEFNRLVLDFLRG